MINNATFQGVLVIGAGAAGLAAAHALLKVGLGVQLLEKELEIGEPWQATTFEAASQFTPPPLLAPGRSYPTGTPAFPHKSLVVDHLRLFSQHHKLPIEHGVDVTGITFDEDHWTVETNAGIRTAGHVVIATGRDRFPDVPRWRGMETFSGKIIHSAFFGDARNFADRKVLVVGAGNSGYDVLNHLVIWSTLTLLVASGCLQGVARPCFPNDFLMFRFT